MQTIPDVRGWGPPRIDGAEAWCHEKHLQDLCLLDTESCPLSLHPPPWLQPQLRSQP